MSIVIMMTILTLGAAGTVALIMIGATTTLEAEVAPIIIGATIPGAGAIVMATVAPTTLQVSNALQPRIAAVAMSDRCHCRKRSLGTTVAGYLRP